MFKHIIDIMMLYIIRDLIISVKIHFLQIPHMVTKTTF